MPHQQQCAHLVRVRHTMEFGDVLDGNQYSPLGCDYIPLNPKTYVRTISGQKKLIFS